MNDDTSSLGDAFAFLTVFPIILAVGFWMVCAVVAAVVAPEDRRMTFAMLTLFLLGPLGVAAAAVAQPRAYPLVQPGTSGPRGPEVLSP